MAKRFHLNWKGEPGECTATVRSCPIGGASDHFDSVSDARAAYEAVQAGSFAAAPQMSKSNRDGGAVEPVGAKMPAKHKNSWKSLDVPDPEDSTIIAKPALVDPGGGYRGGYKFIGGKASGDYVPSKEVAKLARQDIRTAVKANELPSDLDYSVRMSRGGSGIDIYLGAKSASGSPVPINELDLGDERIIRVKRYLEALGNQWGRSDVNSMFDYFNTSNMARVDFRSEWT